MEFNNKKVLIAFFSRNGDNYSNGAIVNLEVGNTEIIANMIQKHTGGELFKIDTVKDYPQDYMKTTEVAKEELNNGEYPELSNYLDDIEDYDFIFLGYPNWWSTMPMAVFSFLEHYNFDNKIIIPFCTHEGSGMGRSENDIKKFAPNSEIAKGLAIKGSLVNNSEKIVLDWINNL